MNLGVEVCKCYKEDLVVINVIYVYYGYEEILSVECVSVCVVDVFLVGCFGVRRKSDEEYVKCM